MACMEESIHFLGGEHRTTGVRSIVIRCHYRQLDLTRKKQIAAVAVLTRYFPLHRTPPTSGYSPLNGLGVHSTSKVPNWLRNAQLCGRPLVECVASTDTGLACAATQCSAGTEGPHDSDASSQSSLEGAYRRARGRRHTAKDSRERGLRACRHR